MICAHWHHHAGRNFMMVSSSRYLSRPFSLRRAMLAGVVVKEGRGPRASFACPTLAHRMKQEGQPPAGNGSGSTGAHTVAPVITGRLCHSVAPSFPNTSEMGLESLDASIWRAGTPKVAVSPRVAHSCCCRRSAFCSSFCVLYVMQQRAKSSFTILFHIFRRYDETLSPQCLPAVYCA